MNNKNLKSNIWKITLSETIFSFGFIGAIYILFFQFLGFSFKDIGLFEAITSVAIILIDLPTGGLADFIGRKWTVVIANTFSLILALMLGLSNGGLLILAIAGILNGFEFSFNSGAKEALLYDTLKAMKKDKDYLKVRGRISSYSKVAGIIGVIVGGFLFSINPRLPYIFWAIFTALGIVVQLFIKEPIKLDRKYGVKEHVDDMKHTIKYIFKTKKLLWISLFFFVPSVLAESYWDIFSQGHLELLKINPAYIGIVFAILKLGSAAVSYFVSDIEKKLGEKKCLYLIIILQSIIFILLAFANNLYFLIGALLLFVINRDYFELVKSDYRNKHIPSKNRASILSGISFLNNSVFGSILIMWTFGFSIDKFGSFNTLFSSGLLVLTYGMSVLSFRYSKKYKRILD